jgi:1-acyl-sn-glycerol-3-phosphate acyltransferase
MYTASWRDVVRRDLFGSAPDPRDRPYRFVIRLALIVFRLFGFRFDVRGAEHVPAAGGAIICSNHVSFFDFTFLGLGALPQHRLVRFMAKSGVFGHWFAGPFMRAMQHIPVDRKAGAAAFESAVRALKDGQVVGVFPEATISRSFTVKDLKAGAARMAVDAGVPLIPAAVWGGQRIATKGHSVVLRRGVPVTVVLGEPIVPEPGEKVQPLLRRTRVAMEALLDEAQRSYPDSPAGPDDRWWLPAHLGGTAPAPDEVQALDAAHAAGHGAKLPKPHPVVRLRRLLAARRR